MGEKVNSDVQSCSHDSSGVTRHYFRWAASLQDSHPGRRCCDWPAKARDPPKMVGKEKGGITVAICLSCKCSTILWIINIMPLIYTHTYIIPTNVYSYIVLLIYTLTYVHNITDIHSYIHHTSYIIHTSYPWYTLIHTSYPWCTLIHTKYSPIHTNIYIIPHKCQWYYVCMGVHLNMNKIHLASLKKWLQMDAEMDTWMDITNSKIPSQW